MKLIPWQCVSEIEAYTTCAYGENQEILNMSFQDDNKKNVLHHRQALAQQLNTDLDHMVATVQQHTTRFIKVNAKDGGKGMYSTDDAFVGYDAMYTRDCDLWLWTFHADCVPILLYCQDQGIIAAIHSGWKGTIQEIVKNVLHHLINEEHCQPEHMYAYIGPALGQSHFEAKMDIIELVESMSFDTKPFYVQKTKESYLLDHKGLILQQLLNHNISSHRITVSPLCTFEREDLFFSYRRNKSPYRQITLIRRKTQK